MAYIYLTKHGADEKQVIEVVTRSRGNFPPVSGQSFLAAPDSLTGIPTNA